MASFDIKSLSTNVSLDEVSKSVYSLYKLGKYSISKNNFRKLLKLSTKEVYFITHKCILNTME